MNATQDLIPVLLTFHFYFVLVFSYLLPPFSNLYVYYIPVIPETTSKRFGKINNVTLFRIKKNNYHQRWL